MRGTYAQIRLGAKVRFIEVHHIAYASEEHEWLLRINSLGESVLGEFLNLAGVAHLCESTRYLYKLVTYVGDPSIVEAWEFNESIEEFEEFGFVRIDALLSFCEHKWGLTIASFVPLEEVGIP